ncbi:ankyrin repeat protein [Marinomonas alcarazii]|uniref:Ankyrin repeat protein n=1 Tax=Marinomonas alcarazii TaxID=491949 RepID=A0A318V4R8_9GAMM|nr:ankyrin repeat protein [Marinomonas alcarazii]
MIKHWPLWIKIFFLCVIISGCASRKPYVEPIEPSSVLKSAVISGDKVAFDNELSRLLSTVGSSGIQAGAVGEAIDRNRTDMLTAMLAAGINPNGRLVNGASFLWEASKVGNVEAIQLLIAAGADVEYKTMIMSNIGFAVNENSPLLIAAERGHTLAIADLLAAGANPNVVATGGSTTSRQSPLHRIFSVYNKSDTILQMDMLLAAGANIDYSDDNGMTALMHAARKCNTDAISYLLSHGADAYSPRIGKYSTLDYAIDKCGDGSKAASLIRQGGGTLNKSTSDDDGLFGKVFATAVIGGIAVSSGISADDAAQVMTATAKDIWSEEGEKNSLATLQQSLAQTSQIPDPAKRAVVERRLYAPKLFAANKEAIEVVRNKQLKQAGSSVANDDSCQSMSANIQAIKGSSDPSLQASYGHLKNVYDESCGAAGKASRTSIKENYFFLVGKGELADCGKSNEDQVELLCLNAKSYYLEYSKQAGNSASKATLDGLYNAHESSARLYIKYIERLRIN